jgi:CheY-like chemotaxis protein
MDGILKNKKLKSLVVDDEKVILSFLNRLLSGWGYEVYTAENTSKALDAIKENEYDFMLLDIRMPNMNGLELFNLVQKIKPEITHKIIFITGDTAGIDTDIFLRKYKIFCVPKPLDTKMLKNKIDIVINTGENTQ